MSEYIKREDAVILLKGLIKIAIKTIKSLPAEDMVEVVRCKDCIWHDHEAEEPGMVYCSEMVGGWVKSNFYCADGERRSE